MANDMYVEISDTEIQQDITDTRREIAEMEAEQKHLEDTPHTAPLQTARELLASRRRPVGRL